MRRLPVLLAALLLLCVGVGQTEAETVMIDFEQFDDTDNLDGIDLGGVTLSSPNGLVEIFDNRFGVFYHSATKAIASPEGLVSANPLVGVFDDPVDSMSLWGGDAGTYTESDSWELRVYDAPTGGNLIESAVSGSWNGSPYRQLSVTAAPIWRFEAIWTGGMYGIGYDDLSFHVIPEPSVVVLAAAGLLILLTHTARRRAGR